MPKSVSFGNRILIVKGEGKEAGVAVFYPLSVAWTDVDDLLFDVALDLDLDEAEQRLVVTRFEVRSRSGGPAVTSTALRSIPFGPLRDAAVAAGSSPVTAGDDGSAAIRSFPGFQRDQLEREALHMATARRESGPTAKLTDEHLQTVAALYRQAIVDGKPTRSTIEKQFTPRPSPSTVARWVQEARRRVDPKTGAPFLRPATGTRAGEA